MDFTVSDLEGKVENYNYHQRHLPAYILSHSYQQRWQQERRDLWKFIPFTVIKQFPVSGNEGLYGFTIPGSGIINQREDLQFIGRGLWTKQEENQIHESIHTNDEYETRILTAWILESMFPREEKYRTRPKEYQN